MKQAQVLGPSSVRLKCQVRTARNITNDIKLKIAWDMGWRPKQDARTREPSNKGFQNRQEFLKQRQAAWASWEQQRKRPPPKDCQKILRIDGVQKAVQAAGRTHKLMQQIVPELSSPWLAEIQKAGENPTEERERAQTPSTSSRGNMAGSDASGLAPRLPGLGAEEASSPIALGATPMSVPGAIGSSSNHDPPAPRPPTAARNGNDDLPAPLPPTAAGDGSSGNPAPDGVNAPVWATQLQELPLVQEAQGDCSLPIGQHLLSSGDNDGTGHEEEDYDWAKEADE